MKLADPKDHDARRAWAFGIASAKASRAEAPIKCKARMVAEGDRITRPCCVCGADNAEAQVTLDTVIVHGFCVPCATFTQRLELPIRMRARIMRWAVYNAVTS